LLKNKLSYLLCYGVVKNNGRVVSRMADFQLLGIHFSLTNFVTVELAEALLQLTKNFVPVGVV
jgi:hypothetical protein